MGVAFMVLWILVFVVAVLALVKAANLFTKGAEELGLFLGLPHYVLGVTVVAVGTSLPELISGIFAVAKGSPEIVVGNVVGANVSNIFLVLGAAAILANGLLVSSAIIKVDLPIFVSAAALLGLSAVDGRVSRVEGAILFMGALIYGVYGVRNSRSGSAERAAKRAESPDGSPPDVHLSRWTPVKIAVGVIGLYFAAEYTIKSVIQLSELLGVGPDLIAISIMAIGTTLPEMVVSVVVTRQGRAEIAVGNVIGSYVFNAFAVVGIPALISPLPVTSQVLSVGLPFMIVGTVLYFFFIAQDREVSRWEGLLLALFYILFMGKLFSLF